MSALHLAWAPRRRANSRACLPKCERTFTASCRWVVLLAVLSGAWCLGGPAHAVDLSASQGTYTDKVVVTGPNSSGYDARVRCAESPQTPYGEWWFAGYLVDGRAEHTAAWPGRETYYWVEYLPQPGYNGLHYYVEGPVMGWRGLAPPAVSASDGTETDGVRLTWSRTMGASFYRVYRGRRADGADLAPVGEGWQDTDEYEDRSAATGVTYYYSVKAAVDNSGTKASIYGAFDAGYRAPVPPARVLATAGTDTTKVLVTWTAVSGASRYRVYRDTAAAGSNRVALGIWQAATSYSDLATPGVTYHYWVKSAVAADGTNPSAFSDSAEGWRALYAPSGVRASNALSDKVTVRWSTVSGATHYRIYRADSPQGTPVEVSGWVTGTAYSDTTAPASVACSYWVKAAVDANGTRASAFGGPATGTRPVVAPTGVHATDGTFADKVHVTWTAAPEAGLYQVYRNNSSDLTKRTALGSPQAGTSYDDASGTPGVTYYYSVQSATAGGDLGLLSGTDAGWRALSGPAGVQATQGTLANSVRVSWEAAPGATHYRVFYATSPTGAHNALSSWQTATTYAHTTAALRVVYCYWVAAATSSVGTRAGAQAGPATGWAGPGGPSGVAASDGTVAAHVRVTWNAVAPGMSYRVYRSTSLAGARSVVGAWRTTTEFKDTAAIPGVIYWYWVTSATSAAGAGESGFGTPDSGYRDLAAPAGVRASDGTTTDNVQVTWDSVSGATHYEVHRASAGAAEAMLSRQTGTTCDDTTATPGVVYSYRVRSVHHPASGEDFLGGFSAADTGWRALAPPVVTAVNGTAGVTLSWAAVEGATHYRLSRATTADAATWTPLGTWLTLRTRLISTSGALYWYTVQAAVNSGGERPSAPSAPVSGYRMPAAPAGVQASDGTYADKVRVTWNAVTGARSYQAYRLEGETPVAVGPWQSGTTCDDAGATPAIIHTYRVRAALDAGGTLPGATSATDTGWRATAAPQVWATDGSYADKVRIVWNRPAGATLFRLWRAPSRTGARIALTDWTATTSYQDTTASPGVTYHYAVQAAGDLRLGGLLGWDTGFRALMAAPEVIYATDGDFADKVLVLWDAVAGATHYRVYRSDMAGARSAVSGWQMDTAFEDTDAVPGDLYFYWVRAAADAQGATAGVWGDWDSGWRSVPAPGSVRASQGDYADKVRVTWDALSWDACYRVWRAAGTGEAAPVSPWQETATFDDTTAVVNVEYRYWVEAALDDAGSGAGGLSDPPAPGWRALPAPTGVTVTRAASSLVVSWGAVTGANQYCVYWATAVDGQRNALSTWQAATQCTHVGPIPGVHYFYWVRARSSAAVTRPGVWSEPASGWIPLGVPTSVAATDGGYVDRVRVTWAAVSRATHYRVERAPAESGPWEDVSDWRTGTSFYDTTAVPGVTYHYRVSAAANSAATLPSDASAPDTGWRKLSAPGDVAATDGTESACVRVSWSAAAGAGAYRVFRGTASSGAGRGALGGWRVGTTFDDTSAAPGSTYYYWVLSGVDEAGARQSSFGTADAGWRSLASPTGLAATDGTEAAHVRVTWSAASGATHYRVSRGTAADGSDRSALSGWQAGTTYDDTTAAPGATYFYWVTAAASSAGMGETAFGTPDSGWRPLAAPAGVSAGDGTRTTGVQVTWAAATGATHYRVYRGTAGDGSDRTPLSDWQTGTSYEDSTATPGVDYTYWVMAAASATGDRPSALSGGDGGWRALAAPTGVTASSDLSMHVEVTWNPVEGATYYKAYRSSDAEGTDRAEVGYGWMPGTFFHDYAAAPGETYYYWVVGAVDDAGGRPGAFGGPDAGSLGGSVTPAPGRTPTPDEDS